MIGPRSNGQFPDGMPAKVATDSSVTDAANDLRSLVDAHFDFVWRSLRRLGVDDAGLDDAVQKVWIVVSRKAEPVRPESARSFLFSIAWRVASDVRRELRRRRQVADDDAIESAADEGDLPDARVDLLRARRVLDRILDEMDDDLRTVFVLFELEELGSPEIAAMLKIPVGTVASRLRRAREVFARELSIHARKNRGAR